MCRDPFPPANFGATDATPEQGDLNSDSVVNLADFNLLAISFGNSCL